MLKYMIIVIQRTIKTDTKDAKEYKNMLHNKKNKHKEITSTIKIIAI